MADDKPKSPFAGLDTSLLRSTRNQTPAEHESLLTVEQVGMRTPPRPPSRRNKLSSETEQNVEVLPSRPQGSGVHADQSARTAAQVHPEIIERIRKIVKIPGKEVSFIRLTPDEKAQFADIVYAYKRRGRKTTENEIGRIAVNLILEDYKDNGQTSVLARVLDALLA